MTNDPKIYYTIILKNCPLYKVYNERNFFYFIQYWCSFFMLSHIVRRGHPVLGSICLIISILITSSPSDWARKISTQLNAGRASWHTQKNNFDGFGCANFILTTPQNYGACLLVLLLFEFPQTFSKETWLAC